MTVPIVPPTPGAGAIGGVGSIGAPQPTAPSPGFGNAMMKGLEAVSNLEFSANDAIQDVATGGDTSIHELMVATSQAQLGIELVAQVRDKAIEAYNEIMRMQV